MPFALQSLRSNESSSSFSGILKTLWRMVEVMVFPLKGLRSFR
jgi:hypothetical protein